MKLIITDTNVFFDIIEIRALPEFFALDYEICTTDFVIHEILKSNQKAEIESFIRAKKLKTIHLDADEVESVLNFQTKRLFKGITDKTVLWKSIELKCPLLTGDKKLRKEAEDWGIEVHGSIWVISELITQFIISDKEGIILFEALKDVNGSLPHEEIDKLIKQLKK
jgi:predicted nucleic acid-binding protein